MKCQKCGGEFPENKIQEHHIHPRFMDNKKGEGMKFYLCEKCHNILHLLIPSILWRYIQFERKKDCIDNIINFTFKYVGEKKDGDTTTT